MGPIQLKSFRDKGGSTETVTHQSGFLARLFLAASILLIAFALACGQKGDPRPRRDLHNSGRAPSPPAGAAQQSHG